MKRFLKKSLYVFIALCIFIPNITYAKQGDCGYEGGISSGEDTVNPKMQYKEIVFVTGEPIVFEGILVIKKSVKTDLVTATYMYSLKNIEKNATLIRTINFTTKVTKKSNGQTIEETSILGTPSEIIKIDGKTYTLKSYGYSRSNIIDPKPAISYFVGNLSGVKVYQIGAVEGTNITIEQNGKYYGYDQYWGTAEVQSINYVLQSNEGNVEKWGGTATVNISSSTSKQIKYVENDNQVISFEGGFLQTQNNISILEYNSKLPEFDSKGIATDHIIEDKNNIKIDTFPQQTRLIVPEILNIRGHWAENDIKTMFSLEILKSNGDALKPIDFSPDEYITRGEFIAAMVRAAKEVPSTASSATTKPTGSKKVVEVSPFTDLPTDYVNFDLINTALKRRLIQGKGDGTLGTFEFLTMADTLTVFIKAMGLEGIAPSTFPVTSFRDNDDIPTYARKAAYVAQKIGLIKGDEFGYLNPSKHLTKAQTATMINRFISYMRNDIIKDYRDNVLGS